MKALIKVLILLSLFIVTNNAYAGGVWSEPHVPVRIEEYGNGIAIRGFGPDTFNPKQCENLRLFVLSPGMSDKQIDRINTLIISSTLSGKKIRLKVNDSHCEGGFRTFYAVALESGE